MPRFLFSLFLVCSLLACAPSSQQVKDKALQADIHFKLGLSHLQADNPTLALKELLIAVENGPDNDSIHAVLAQTYQLKKAYSQAEFHYMKALELSNNAPRYQNNLGSLYIDMKEWDKAIDYFDKAASNLLFLSPYIALTGKGYAYLQKKDYPAALLQFEEVIAIAPKYAQAYYYQSEVYMALDEIDKAQASLGRAVEVSPEFVQARYRLGELAIQQEMFAVATEQFEKVVELSPKSELGIKAAKKLRTLEQSTADDKK